MNKYRRYVVRRGMLKPHQLSGNDGDSFSHSDVYAKDRENVHVRLKVDNTTVICYINRMGGT